MATIDPPLSAIDRLLVLWSRPDDGTRIPVGQLWREGGEYFFDFEPGAADAAAAGFILPAQFHADLPWRSHYLFPLFAQRIPHPQRADRDATLRDWGVVHRDDPFEILARSGGIQMTDRLELAEFRASDDPMTEPLEFRIAGPRHAGPRLPEVGLEVGFERDRENKFDPAAVRVVDLAGASLGFVPRHYSAMFARLLDSGARLDGEVVRQLVVPESKWVVRARRRG
jgi:hypothetical protein